MKTGSWGLARELLARGARDLGQAVTSTLRQEAERLRAEIVRGLTDQVELAPPAAMTLAARRLGGFVGEKALLVRGELRSAIATIVSGDRAFVGVPRKAGPSLADIAQLNEFGSGPIVIPMTAAMRRFLHAAAKEAGEGANGGGTGRGVVVVQIPARPFLRPAFRRFARGAQERFLRSVARRVGLRGA